MLQTHTHKQIIFLDLVVNPPTTKDNNVIPTANAKAINIKIKIGKYSNRNSDTIIYTIKLVNVFNDLLQQ